MNNIKIVNNIYKDQMRINISYVIFCLISMINIKCTQLCIKRSTFTQLSSTLTITFDTIFSNMPDFAYAIQSLQFQQTAVKFKYDILNSSLTSHKIRINITTLTNILINNDKVTLAFLFTNFKNVQMNIITVTTLTSTVLLKRQHMYRSSRSYSLNIFALCIPINYQLTSKSSTNFGITFIGSLVLGQIIFSYVLVQKIFIANKIFVLFDLINQVRRDFVILIDSQNYLAPSDNNSFLGLSQAVYSSPHLRLNKFVLYSYFDLSSNRPAIKTGYMSTGSSISLLKSSFITFNPQFTNCPSSSFLAYNTPYTTIAQSCRPCHFSCQTCTSSQQDSTYTDQRYCLSCPIGRYLQLQVIDNVYGLCLCLKGTVQGTNGTCIECKFNCLSFSVTFMKSQTQAVFLMIFTQSQLLFTIPYTNNLKISINANNVNYTYTSETVGVYTIILNNQDMKPCQQNCQIIFKFQIPHYIYVQVPSSSSSSSSYNKYLVKQQQVITIQDFYIVGDRLPQQLNQAFLISSLLIGASSATGQTAMIKMLFQLQQIIQVHKYLNIQIPVVFKQFIQALSTCRFLDITTVIDYDINAVIRNLSPNSLDLKGAPKIIYYQHGVNFYKNIVAVMVSLLIIIIFNFIFYLILKIIPLNFTKKLSQKIQIRWMISLSDLIQTLVIPISLFAAFQLSYISYKINTIWIYILTYMLFMCIFLFPFYVIVYTDRLRKNNNQVDKQIVQDLFLDCKLHNKIAEIYYLYNFMKKFMFGIFLSMNVSGLIQLFILITINIIHMLIIIYIIVHKIYNSKLKILTRSINLLCVIALEGIILGYNMNYNNIEDMILMGVTCTYLTIIVTLIGIVEIIIKLFQVIFQKIKENNKKESVEGDIVVSQGRQSVNNQGNDKVKDKKDQTKKYGSAAIINFQGSDEGIQQNKIDELQQYKQDKIKINDELEKNKKNQTQRFNDKNRRKISTQVPETISQNSDIVPINSSDFMKQTIQHQFGRIQFYKRPADRLKKMKEKINQKRQQNLKRLQNQKPQIFEYDEKDIDRREDKMINKKIIQTKKSIQSNERKTMASIQQKTRNSIQSTFQSRKRPKKAAANIAKDRLIVQISKPKKSNNIQIQSSMSEIVPIQQN